MLVHPSPTLLNGIATICCRDEFLLLCRIEKDISSPEAARSHQQGSLLHAAVFSRASPSSWSMENKLIKMSPENQNHSSIPDHPKAKRQCRGHREEAEGLVDHMEVANQSLQEHPMGSRPTGRRIRL